MKKLSKSAVKKSVAAYGSYPCNCGQCGGDVVVNGVRYNKQSLQKMRKG